MKRIVQWAGTAGALLALGHALPGFRITDFNTALFVALAYGLLVTLVDLLLIPFAYTIFIFVPRTIWNLGCLLVVNAGVMLALAHWTRGFRIAGWEPAAIAALVLAAVSWVLGMLF